MFSFYSNFWTSYDKVWLNMRLVLDYEYCLSNVSERGQEVFKSYTYLEIKFKLSYLWVDSADFLTQSTYLKV